MAEGIRIQHVSRAGPGIIAIKDMSEPFQAARARDGKRYWPACSICGIPGTREDQPISHQGFKTRHVEVDTDGYAIVSTGIWKELQKFIDNGGFEYANPVPEPPSKRIDMGNGSKPKLTVHHKVPRDLRSP